MNMKTRLAVVSGLIALLSSCGLLGLTSNVNLQFRSGGQAVAIYDFGEVIVDESLDATFSIHASGMSRSSLDLRRLS